MTALQLNTEEANRAAVLRIYREAFNQRKLEIADQLISPAFINSGPDGGQGPEAFKRNALRLLNAFPDVQFTVHDLVAEGEQVALYWTWEGTHRGVFNNIPPTGKRVRHEGMSLYRFEAGTIAATRVAFDRLSVLQQLGVPPSPPAAPANPKSPATQTV